MSPCFEDVLSLFWHMVQHPTQGRELMGIWGATRGLWGEGGFYTMVQCASAIMGALLTQGTAMIHGIVKHSAWQGDRT